ncbi:LolA family protein [Desulfuromonas acetexigens]|uniref:Outer membrane lipoprotein carrier protein LolA n=1 Tax=Trichloromonas acetexigens TaxID=38815 RepID=A0A550JFA2_9BACT|nr:outer membrane lipoprotein carrier protein LolA [Desulfuromonas acetexigens]TRO81886.1 outer membrane lipoprotein carrier protein LolA [Desulfuromonas acetexigens]
MKYLLPLWLLLFVSLPLAAWAEEDAELERVLAGLKVSAAGIETLASDFTQEKHLEIFRETLVSQGRFYFAKPDKLRWETTAPVASGFLLNGSGGKRWHQRAGAPVPFDLGREPGMKLIAEQLLAWARVDLDWLRSQYEIALVETQPVSLRLVPRQVGARDFLDHLLIRFDDGGRHVASVAVHEPGGDRTLIRFSATVLNQPLDPALF